MNLKKLFRRTPLAWLQVRRERTRLLVAALGIAFADILIFFQLGLMAAVFDAATAIHANLNGDLFLINALSDNMLTIRTFPRTRLFQAGGIEGVESVNSIYTSVARWRNPDNGTAWQVQIYCFDPANPSLLIPDANIHLNKLKMLNAGIYDRSARPSLGEVASKLAKTNYLTAQVNNFQIQVVGVFTLGASFSADGNLLVSDSTFLRLFPDRSSEQIDIGTILLKPNANIQQVQTAIRDRLPDDVLVLTKQELINREKNYWGENAPIGIIFGFGTIVGFLVGTIIVYQILYTDVSDHLPEYATLKAMGYGDRYLMGVVLQEAIILSFFGFIPGFVISFGLYGLIAQATFLPVAMTIDRFALVLFLTLGMCGGSGAIAMGKLQSADPADIF
ncbi:MAG: ABC transporter permease DevC [Pseudanabaenaceae cyanobacterium bins.68]|nr:ABC transporter permease DevC [Pseudanabaenaceae cyanobacterium bins.68]